VGTRMPMTSFTQRRRAWWFSTAGVLLVVFAIGIALPLDRLWNLQTSAAPSVIAPKVLTVTMFQTGDPLADGSGEASVWVKNDTLDQVIQIPGSYSPLYCNASFDHCLVITGVLAANAAATVMAVGLSERVDLSRSYIMVAGVGGGAP
jgi:purine nucleoside permease